MSKIHIHKPDERNIESCINLEKLSLHTSSKIIFCSEWIKYNTVETYKIDPDKIEVVEFGANIPTPTNYSSLNIDISVSFLE